MKCDDHADHDLNLDAALLKTPYLLLLQHQQHRAEHHDDNEDEDGNLISLCFDEIDGIDTCALGQKTSWLSASCRPQNQGPALKGWKQLSRELVKCLKAIEKRFIVRLSLSPFSHWF